MSIPEMQACLARLYVDHSFLRLFLLQPGAALEEYRLSDDERSSILEIDRHRLQRFAESLVVKRKKRFEIAYPLLFGLDHEAVSRYYERFYRLRRISPYDVQLKVCVEFGHFLEDSLAADADFPPWASDLARYERALYTTKFLSSSPEARNGDSASDAADGAQAPADEELLAAIPSLHPEARIERFRYDLQSLQKALKAGERPREGEIAEGEHFIVFLGGGRPGRARTFEITPATRRLLALCDGHRTVVDILHRLEQHYGKTGLEPGVLKTLRRMLEPGILRLDRARS